MSTDLERSIRAALLARASTVVPRQNSLRARTTRRWLPPTLAAATVVILVVAISLVTTLRSHDSSGPAASPAASAVGYRWRLAVVDDQYGRLRVPSSLRATLGFSSDGSITANDAVNVYGGRYQLTVQGYEASAVAGSGAGSTASGSSDAGRVIAAIGSILPAEAPTLDVAAHVVGGTLTLHGTGGRTLTLRRDGTEPDGAGSPRSPTPTPTPTR